MYKLYIVDDEPLARNGLRNYFNWSEFGIQVIGEGDDGESSFQEICDLKPDILITDVKMPNMNGMELSRLLRSVLPNIKIIFISAYSEIEYLKSALELDAVDYILKPINLNSLRSIIEKTVNLLNEEKKQQNLIAQLNEKLEVSMPLLREKFFMTLIQDETDDIVSIHDRIQFLDINMETEGQFCVFVISVDDRFLVLKGMTEKARQMLSMMLTGLCETILAEHCNGYAFENKQGEYVCILHSNASLDRNKLYFLAQEMKDKILIEYDFSVTIGIGAVVHNIIHLHKSYLTANKAVQQKVFIGKNQIIPFHDTQLNSDVDFYFDYRALDHVSMLLKAADKDNMTAFLKNIFGEMKQQSTTINWCRSFSLQLYLTSLKVLSEIDPSLYNDASKYNKTIWDKLFVMETIWDIQTFITDYLLDICNQIRNNNHKKSKNIIYIIKKIIQDKYHTNITIQDIANEVHLTHTYICLIFKQETGETINDYLTRFRMEKAKEMLRTSSYKLSEIGHAIGYADISYFCKLFKKHTGLTPGKYREEFASNG